MKSQAYLACARHKLQKQRLFLLGEAFEHVPEVADLRVGRLVSVVVGVRTQVVQVNVRQAADEQLQLLRVEDGNQLRRHQLVEALEKRVDLCEYIVYVLYYVS